MPFRSIVGHRHVVELLARAVRRDSLPPSLILSGPEGVGKRRVARALAQALNCVNFVRGDEGFQDACGTCPACRRIEKGTHPDVLLVNEEGVHPEVVDVDVKENSAVIAVDVVRKVIETARFRPYDGRRRVIIIDPADAMERFSQNALLKVLEETPPATVFVLITSRPDTLLTTVRSRCPQIRFGPMSVAEVAQVLVAERGLSERDARAAAIVGSGSVARAIEAASEDSTDARSQALTVLQQAATAREPLGVLEAMKSVFGMEKRTGVSAAVEREQVSLSLRALSSLLRDLTLMQANGQPATAGQGPSDLANADLRADLERVAASFNRSRVMRAFAAVDRALGALAANVNPKVVVDWLAFQI